MADICNFDGLHPNKVSFRDNKFGFLDTLVCLSAS